MGLGPFDQVSLFVLEEPLFGWEELSVRSPRHGFIDLQLSLVVLADQQIVNLSLSLDIIELLFYFPLILFGSLISDLRLFGSKPFVDFAIGLSGLIAVNDGAGGILNRKRLTFMRENRFW